METDSLGAASLRREPPPAEGRLVSRRDSSARQVLAGLLVLALVAGLALAHRLRTRAEESGTERAAGVDGPWVDPAAARVASMPEWVDPRWLEHVGSILREFPPLEVGPAPELADLREELEHLSFVERVERCELSAENGLELELTLREPVACIPVRGEFALVDEDGVVLEGRWPVPPRLGRAWLPVLGPLDDPLFARARAGDWLVEPEHTDALDVALSMAEHLDAEEREALGRVVIDARAARRASVTDPGVRLELEGARLAVFGRAPGTDEPGELEAASKWRSLARALELFERDPAGGDWDLVDLRWDRPDIALRQAPAVAMLDDADAPRARTHASRTRDAGDDSRPRVR